MASINTASRIPLSGGLTVTVSATSSGSPDSVHTNSGSAGQKDMIYLWANNAHSAAVALTFIVDGVEFVQTIEPDQGLEMVVPGIMLPNGEDIEAYAGTAGVITLFGYVDRVTEL